MRDIEHQHQAALFQWADVAESRYPELGMMFAVPNGGKRNIRVAQKLKAEGVKRGIPDIFLDVPRQGYHGLRIELKAPGKAGSKGRLSPEQKARLEAYQRYGYLAVACWGWEEARGVIVGYLSEDN